MEQSWRPATRKKYDAHLRKWRVFCEKRAVDWIRPPISACVDFLASLHSAGMSYSAINTARSALSAVVLIPGGNTVGEHALVRRVMRGVFVSRPPKARHEHIWDISVVLNLLRRQSQAVELSLRDLSRYVVTLLVLLTGQRCQTIAQLSGLDVVLSGESVCIRVIGLLKTSRPGHHMGELTVKGFAPDPKICIVRMMRAYLEKTQSLRAGAQNLFISYRAPHRPVGPATIGRWIKAVLLEAGVKGFTAHSTRVAAASAAKEVMPVDQILTGVGWASERTFAKYYDKPIIRDGTLGEAILGRMDQAGEKG